MTLKIEMPSGETYNPNAENALRSTDKPARTRTDIARELDAAELDVLSAQAGISAAKERAVAVWVEAQKKRAALLKELRESTRTRKAKGGAK